MSLRLCQFLAVGLALLLVVDFRSSSAAPADGLVMMWDPHMMMGPELVTRALMRTVRHGPSIKSVRMMQSLQGECFDRLKVKLPASLTQPIMDNNQNDNMNKGDEAPRSPYASQGKPKEFTYENVRDAAVENVKNMTQPLDFEIGIIDNLIKVVDEAGKFMESLPADQHKAMVLCLHEVAIQEPLRAEKKGLQMASRLACEVKSKMLNQPADKCV